jgi:hypothetical protein
VRRIALHGLDQVWNEVVALAQLHINVGKGLIGALAHRHQVIVDHDRPDGDHDNHDKDDPTERHALFLVL